MRISDWSSDVCSSDLLKIDSDRMNATAVVLADLGEGVYRGMLEGRINDYRIEGFGTVNLTADVDIESVGDRGFGVDGRFGDRTAKIENETVRDLFGGEAVCTGRLGQPSTEKRRGGETG